MIKYISCYSGAGFKIAHHAGVKYGESLLDPNKYKAVAYYGVSSGSIIQFAANISGVKKMAEKAVSFTSDDVFYQDPLSFSGKVYAGVRLIAGRLYLYDQSKLEKTLRSVVSESDFLKWQNDESKAPIFAVSVDFETAEVISHNLKFLTYSQAILAVMASSSIPVYTKPIELFGRQLVDGGVRTHCPSPLALSRHKDIDLCLSVFSRPEQLEHYKYNMPKEKLFSANALKIAGRVLDITNLDISESDARIADAVCKESNIEHIKIFTEELLGNGVYETTKEDNRNFYKLGLRQFKNTFKHG